MCGGMPLRMASVVKSLRKSWGWKLQRLAVGAGDAGGGERAVEQVADAVGGDGPVLQADAPLEQQRHRRVPGALVGVVGGDQRDGAVGAADPGDDGGQDVGELGADDEEPLRVGLGRGDRSSGTSSPVAGSRYWTRLWWDSSVSSSTRMPVWRRTSMAAQAQNALSSSRVRSRRLPVPGSSAQVRRAGPGRRAARRSVCPAAVNISPGPAAAGGVQPGGGVGAARGRRRRRGRAGRGAARGSAGPCGPWARRLLLVLDVARRGWGRARPTAPTGPGRPAAHWAMSR